MLVVPRWSAEGVKERHQLFVVNEDGEKVLNSITAALINYTSIIGISEITDENIDEVSCRVALLEAICGPLLISNNAPRFLSREEIARHVGLCTEAYPLPLEVFWKNMLLANRTKNDAEEKGTTCI
ncbi:MAG: hypothetical protein E6G97_21930 [Alphaproteobacteria bacterium]|nr:MAG: hypothetical protein E6G97_21930 [Alphaproteobacteria bacterium]